MYREMVSLRDAQSLVLAGLKPTGTEQVDLIASLDRVLAEDFLAILNVPPFDRSPLDGFAVHSEDCKGELPVKLSLLGEIPAGTAWQSELPNGCAVRILTGSPLPRGADAVVRQEDTAENDGVVVIHSPVKAGMGISRQGEDIALGELLLAKGSPVSSAALGVLASQGVQSLNVYALPKVAVASTGDELVDVGQALSHGQIYNSNFYTLFGLIHSWGGVTRSLGLIKDRVDDLAAAMERGLEDADVVVTTGGASVGTYDVTVRAMQAAGIDVLFWRVAMKPGTPVVCGRKGNKLVIGLSGNPAAAMISADLILGPVVRTLAGYRKVLPKNVRIRCTADFSKPSGVLRMIRANSQVINGELVAALYSQQQPGVLKSMLAANVLLQLPPNSSLQAGQWCEGYLTEEWEERK